MKRRSDNEFLYVLLIRNNKKDSHRKWSTTRCNKELVFVKTRIIEQID